MAKPFLIFRPGAPRVWYIFAVSGNRACMQTLPYRAPKIQIYKLTHGHLPQLRQR